jgi:regulator of RNase E activity RraA
MYYNEIATYPWMDEIEEGDFIALDMSGVNVGLMGSENTLRCLARGSRGFILNGAGMRDTEEVIGSKIPVWNHFVSQAMDQARIQFDAKNVPVAIGGVTIFPGDIIVADNDGVIVVPRSVAETVAKQAHRMLSTDMSARRALYLQIGLELDDSVKDVSREERQAFYKKMGWDDMIR